jgi:hypothetical protein
MGDKVLHCKEFHRPGFVDTKVYCEDLEFLNTLETCLRESNVTVSVISRLEMALQIMKDKERGNK